MQLNYNKLTCLLFPLALCAPLAAADWSGPYVGVNLGRGTSTGETTRLWSNYGVVQDAESAGEQYDPVKAGAKGGLLGLQAGYNQQVGKVVFGIEADLAYARIKGEKASPMRNPDGSPYTQGTYNRTSQEIHWTGSVSLKLGLAVSENVLPYVSLGAATARVKDTADADFSGQRPGLVWDYPSGTTKKSPTGVVFGAGVEWRFQKRLSAKLDVTHYELGSTSSGDSPLVNNQEEANAWTAKYTWAHSFNEVRLGVNYRF